MLLCISLLVFGMLAWLMPQTYSNRLNTILDKRAQDFITDWQDLMRYAIQPDYLTRPATEWTMTMDTGTDGFDMEEFERQLSQVAAMTQRAFLGTPSR